MSRLLDEDYLTWLYELVANPNIRDRRRTHWKLLKQLYNKEFFWHVPNDDNRAADGKDLRYEFLNECGISPLDPDWLSLGCSMLELLIGLARSLAFITDGETPAWFWHLIEVMDLEKYNDANYDENAEWEIDTACNRIIDRSYDYNGEGGLFPLRRPERDQREVELWYQLNAFIIELM